MPKWGRRSWLYWLFGTNRQRLWSGRPFSKIKTVHWGSRAVSPVTRRAPRKWGSRRPAIMTMGGRSTKRSPSSLGSKRRLGTRPRLRKRTIVIIILVFMMIFSIQSFIYIERNLRPPLMHVAKVRVKQIATEAINKAITEQVAHRSESDKLIDWKMNSDGKVSGFMLNYAEHMSITSQTINTVQSTLKEMKEIPERIPIGHALNSAIISSFGPRVPVRFEPVGAVKVDLNTRQKDAGINMILVEVYIRIIAEITIIIPFDTDPELVETELPISYLLVVGDVPMYYYDSKGNPVGETAAQAPNISVPLSQGGSSGVTSTPEKSSNSSEESKHSGASSEAAPAGGTDISPPLDSTTE